MSTFGRWVAAAALAMGTATAGAGMHQICYEGMPENHNGVWVPNGIFGCAIDGPGWCSITPVSTGFVSRSPYPLAQTVQAAGTFQYYDFSSSAGTFTAKMQFFDGNSVKLGERLCTVNARGMYTSSIGYATGGAVLTGFSTDESGLATTGVWRLQATADASWRRLSVRTPDDFVAVGGGAIGAETPAGALIAASKRDTSYDQRSWMAATSDLGAAQPHRTTVFVIGLHIEGLASRDLVPLLQTNSATTLPALSGAPSTQATQPVLGGSVIVSGSIDARASDTINQLGQFATVSAPVTGATLSCTPTSLGFTKCRTVMAITGWRVESKDHVLSHPGWVSVDLHQLPLTVNVGGAAYEVRSKQVTATSAVAAHPSVDVSGLRGEYALTGIGATVDWRRFDQFGNQIAAGNLLWKLEPRADLGGASVASKDHLISSPASITGFALGIKLVPAGTQTIDPICCFRL